MRLHACRLHQLIFCGCTSKMIAIGHKLASNDINILSSVISGYLYYINDISMQVFHFNKMFKQAGRKRPTKQKMVDTDDMIPKYQAALNELKQQLATE